MNKVQAYYDFWTQFGWPVYDGTDVPDDAKLPRITYDFSQDSFGTSVALNVSLWERSTSWKGVEDKQLEIASAIGRGGCLVPYDGGAFWIKKASPWAQRLGDSDDTLRRIVLAIEVEFLD